MLKWTVMMDAELCKFAKHHRIVQLNCTLKVSEFYDI